MQDAGSRRFHSWKPALLLRRLFFLRQHFGERGRRECCFHLSDRVINASMKWAELHAVRRQSDRTPRDPLQWINGIDDIENGNLASLFGQRYASTSSSPRSQHASACQRLDHFAQIRRWNLRRPRDFFRRARARSLSSDKRHRAQCIFSRLRKQRMSSRRS